MTLNGHYAIYLIVHVVLGTYRVNMNADRLYRWENAARGLHIVSGNITFMQIFAGTGDFLERGVK